MSAEEVLKEYRPWMVKFARRYTPDREQAEDAVQRASIRVIQAWSGYRGDNFKNWVGRIIRNVLKDDHRKDLRRGMVLSLDAPLPDTDDIYFDPPYEQRDFAFIEGGVFEVGLSPSEVELLLDSVGYSNIRMAREMGISDTALKSRLCRLRKKARRYLEAA